jgi:hypothetical protein
MLSWALNYAVDFLAYDFMDQKRLKVFKGTDVD